MARLSADQIAAMVLARGFADPVRATAVVLGESGGDPQATNRNTDGSTDYGLWQINSRWHIDTGQITQADAVDPIKSTDYAYKISNGGRDFRLWVATRQSSFAGHLDTARPAVERAQAALGRQSNSGGSWWQRAAAAVTFPPAFLPGLPGMPDIPGFDIPNPIGAAQDAAGVAATIGAKLLDPAFWRRIGLGLAGVLVLVLGVLVFFRRDALGVAMTAFPAGRVAGAAKAGAAARSGAAALAN
jgi:hypothetical protein